MRRIFATVIAATLVAAIGAQSPAGAAPTKCLVVNIEGNTSYQTLQAGVDAATAGSTLTVKGTCIGTTTIDKDLTITGKDNPRFGTSGLDGGNFGTVVTVSLGAHVSINDLIITHGSADFGGGILNLGGSVTLNGSSSVTGNTAGFGGGILNRLGGTVTLNDSSSVAGNAATIINGTGGDGGGINNYGFNEGSAVILNDSSSVAGNTAASTGGGIFNNVSNTVTFNDNSTVERNSGLHAGGIWNDGAVMLRHTSAIKNNTVQGLGGGIFNSTGTVALENSASIVGNSALLGGGIFNASVDTVKFGTVTLSGSSSITGNTAILGGGMWNQLGGVVTLNDGSSVTGNSPDNCQPLNTIPGCIS
jgi:hypothetical protein